MNASDRQGSPGPTRQYIKRKKSSLGDTKIAIIGAPSVGKSALSVRFLTKRFIGEYDHTTDTKYKHTVLIDGETIALEILDTRCLNNDIGLREDIVRWADGFLLVYAITCHNSLEALTEARKRIEDNKKVINFPMVLVGNKNDLTHIRQVTSQEGLKLSEELLCPFNEVSASDDITEVIDVFHQLIRDVTEYKRRSRKFFDKVFGSLSKKT